MFFNFKDSGSSSSSVSDSSVSYDNSTSSDQGNSSSSTSDQSTSNILPNPDETIAPDSSGKIDTSNFPSGNSGTKFYKLGYSQAKSSVENSALTRIDYEIYGGLSQSCEIVLNTFVSYSTGAGYASGTRQQYADFMLGCEDYVKKWYSS